MRGGSERRYPSVKGCFTVMAVCIMTFLITSVGVSLILFFSEDPTRHISIISSITFLVSAVISARVAIALTREGLSSRIFGSLLFLFSALILSLILGGGHIGGAALMNSLCYFLIFVFSSIIEKRKRKGRRKRR